VEGMMGLAYSIRQKKPIVPVIITSVIANLITQFLLRVALNTFFQHYLVTLFIAEIFIWIIESFLLYGFRLNQLNIKESLSLSLIMNLASFSFGLLLPI
jgi:hypothetical protein